MKRFAQTALRIRCEGQLEVLEQATARYTALARALAEGDCLPLRSMDFERQCQASAAARAEVERRLDAHRVEAGQALAAFEGAQVRAHEAMAAQAQSLGVDVDADLEGLGRRLQGHLPVQARTEVRLLSSSRQFELAFQGGRALLAVGLVLGLLGLSEALVPGQEGLGPRSLWSEGVLHAIRFLLTTSVTGALLGLFAAFTATDSRAHLAARARRARLVLTQAQLTVGAHRWRLEDISRVDVEQGVSTTLSISSAHRQPVAFAGGDLEAVVRVLEARHVPLGVSSSPARSIAALRIAAQRNQAAVPEPEVEATARPWERVR